MHIPGLTTKSLKTFYETIRNCLHEDDNTPPGTDKPYGVRQFADWREMANQLEDELNVRNEPFTKIVW